jgi:hypothetical protein
VVSLGYAADGKRICKKVSGQTRTEVKDKLKALHSELDAGVRTAAGYTVDMRLPIGWPRACRAGPPRRSRSAPMHCVRCSQPSGGSRCGT